MNNNSWSCRAPGGAYIEGHRPTSRKPKCYDSWDHIQDYGTRVGMVRSHPWSALLQGAEDYLRGYMTRYGNERDETVDQVRAALERWDTQPRPAPDHAVPEPKDAPSGTT